MTNKIKDFFGNINIKYKDLPYLYFPLLVVTLLVVAAWFIWGDSAILWGFFVLATYIILATQFHLYRSTRKDLENHQEKMQAYFSLFPKLNPNTRLPFMTGWAATPQFALVIYEEVKKNRPEQILEIGSGVSTIVAAYGLKQNGKGTVLSLDHDEKYGAKTEGQLQQHGVEEFSKVKYAPLVSYQLEDSSWQWYDMSSITLPQKIDMLLIDGPPVKTNKNARYPALPLLADRLNDQCVVIVHDANRPSERAIIDKWQCTFPQFSCEIIDTEKGIAILSR